MKLSELLSFLGRTDLPECEILSVTDDSRKACEHSLFVCICGARFDGHALSGDAYKNGCRVFVAQTPLPLPDDATVITVQNTRTALSYIASAFYRHPAKSLRLIGITGTKGKTTTAKLIQGVLEQNGICCGYIGTNGIFYKDIKKQTKNTTPDPLTLQATLADMLQKGVETAVLEVSSQALLQNRVEGVPFETAVFTNLSLDHVGPLEHESFEEYKACKHLLFTSHGAEYAIWNSDDPASEEMCQGATASKSFFYSLHSQKATCTVQGLRPVFTEREIGSSFTVGFNGATASCTLPLIGTCNVYNALCAVCVAVGVFGISLTDAARALERASVEGRSEWYALPSGAIVVIDYAHNRESLTQILLSLREYSPKRLWCLFGSVGERSQLRRRDLAEVAAHLADHSVITSDNPGHEPAERIVAEIASHFPQDAAVTKITDRKEAILYVLRQAKCGDIVLLAGKGHETYQLIKDEKRPFDERAIVEDFIGQAISSAHV